MTNLDSILKKQRHHLINKGPHSQSYGFSSSDVWKWELNHKEGWPLNNWCIWIVVVEETLESPLDCKEIKPIHSEGNQPWVFTGKTDPEAEAPILWPSHEMERPWCRESLKARGEGDNRGQDGWTVSSKLSTWIWHNSGRQWKTGGSGVLCPMGSWRVGHN